MQFFDGRWQMAVFQKAGCGGEKKELSINYRWKISCGQIEIRYHSEGYWDDDTSCSTNEYLKLIDWLNSHHFDYRGLIEKGLALPAPEGMYKID